MDYLSQPEKFWEVRFHNVSDKGRSALCVGYEQKEWRNEAFADYIITLPAHINIDDVSKQIMMLKSDPNEWEIDTNVIKQLAIFCLNKFKENKDIVVNNNKIVK